MDTLITAITDATGMPREAIAKALVRSGELKHGDYAFPCFLLSKTLKLAPPACAEKLKGEIKLPPEFERAENVGPYLNFFLKRDEFARQTVSRIIREGYETGRLPDNSRTVIVDYSGPNIAKNLAVAHMRTTLIGLSLYRIYKHLGYRVIGINHLGDWGVQFGYVWAGCRLWGTPEDPTIDALVRIYVRASALKKAQEEKNVPPEDQDKPDIAAMAREYFIRLEGKDEDARKFWKWCQDLSLEEFKKVYSRLGIEFDYHTGESFYEDMIPGTEERIRQSGILEESRGALGVDLGKKLGFARIFAEDGRSLYITRDIAAATYRDKTFSPEKILYVVAAQQDLHFKQLVEILKRMNDPVAEKIVHVAFGFVPGMRTREGSVITIREFLEEAYERALQSYRQEVVKKPEGLDEQAVAESVAIGATYFYFLKHTNIKDFNFSWQEALNFQGDSGVYVQYSLARLYSIESKAREAGITPDGEFDGARLKDDDAWELVSLLSRFGEIAGRAAAEYEPSHIAAYLLDIAKVLSRTYKQLRVVGEEKEIAKARLALFIAARNVMRTGMVLIGMPPVERM